MFRAPFFGVRQEGMAVYDAAMLDPFVMLTAVGARTTRLRLAPFVPFRHPASLAKIAASLDIKRLWAGETIAEHGEFWGLDEVRVTPQPAQRPGSTDKQRSAHVHR
jgi:alkanesulfonate monooxygenase SsuD/methylene tetrahydromethanopterin reductase-like flavin-dependent oxidoreductase (luciferase family)